MVAFYLKITCSRMETHLSFPHHVVHCTELFSNCLCCLICFLVYAKQPELWASVCWVLDRYHAYQWGAGSCFINY